MEGNSTNFTLLPRENTTLEDDVTTKAMSHIMYRIGELYIVDNLVFLLFYLTR